MAPIANSRDASCVDVRFEPKTAPTELAGECPARAIRMKEFLSETKYSRAGDTPHDRAIDSPLCLPQEASLEASMRRALIAVVAIALALSACGGTSNDTTTTDAPGQPTTTAPAPATTTTTEPATTSTTIQATTTTATAGATVAATPVIGYLEPYSPGGADLFPPGSVEAHWYQWGDRYVVLYRGFNAADGSAICAGNSVFIEGVGFGSISDSPYNGAEDEICVGSQRLAEPPSGAFACDTLLYYVTEIPSDVDGALWGTLAYGDGQWEGQTSQAISDLANTPVFEPGLEAWCSSRLISSRQLCRA